MIQFNTRGKKSEPGLRKQLNIDVKSATKFYFFFKYMNIIIYFTNIRCFRFSILYFKYLQILILCATTFYKTAFYYNVFRRRLKSRNIKMVKVSYVLHYKCLFLPKFNKLSKFSCCVVCSHFIWRVMSKYEAIYFVGDNQVINRVRVDSSKTRNRGAFSGSLAALLNSRSVLPPDPHLWVKLGS